MLKLHIRWEKMLSDLLDEEYMNLSFAFNLGDLFGRSASRSAAAGTGSTS